MKLGLKLLKQDKDYIYKHNSTQEANIVDHKAIALVIALFSQKRKPTYIVEYAALSGLILNERDRPPNLI